MPRPGANVEQIVCFDDGTQLAVTELAAVVVDDARLGSFALAQCRLQLDGNGPACQLKEESMMDHIATVRVDKRQQEVVPTADPRVQDIRMPLLIRTRRFEGIHPGRPRRVLPPSEQVRLAEHSIHRTLAHCGDVLVQHHVRQLPVARLRMSQRELLDRLDLVGEQPVVAGRPARSLRKRSLLRPRSPGIVDTAWHSQTRQNRIQRPLAPSLCLLNDLQHFLPRLRAQTDSSL